MLIRLFQEAPTGGVCRQARESEIKISPRQKPYRWVWAALQPRVLAGPDNPAQTRCDKPTGDRGASSAPPPPATTSGGFLKQPDKHESACLRDRRQFVSFRPGLEI